MRNSLNKSVTFKVRPSNFVVGLQDAPTGDVETRRRFDMKEVQRRAFERGKSVERERYARTIQEMVQAVGIQSEQMQAAFQDDREKVESFAVNLALKIAEDLTRTIIDQEQHNVANMVRDLMQEIDGETAAQGLSLKINPADHAAILEAAANTEISIEDVEMIPDASVPVASPILIGGNTQYYSNLEQRLQQIKNAMREESRHAIS